MAQDSATRASATKGFETKTASPSANFPRNAWYAAAWDVEIKNALFPRTIAGQKVVMYRSAKGQIVALEDACWHRLLPLSYGRIEDDQVVCGYHGLKFDQTGRCTRMPAQEAISPSARVRAFPAIEKHRFIWIWPGDPALADPTLIPDLHWNDDPAWRFKGERLALPGNYLLLLNQPGANAWPITGATFILMHKKQTNAQAGHDVLAFYDWAYKNGDAAADQLDYVPLPPNVKALIRKSWSKVVGPDGKPVYK